jgi:hypothetical protein
MNDKDRIFDMLKQIGEALQFQVFTEVAARGEYWVDMVWFDNRIPSALFGKKPSLASSFMLPMVAFEIEIATSAGKHIKGTVKNLESLGAPVSCIVVCEEKMQKHLKSIRALARDSVNNIAVMTDKEVEIIYNKLVKK